MSITFPLYAGEIFPKGCVPQVIEQEFIALPAATSPRVVMIHNLLNTTLWITHLTQDPDSANSWSSRLQPNHWSALMQDGHKLKLHCIESTPGHEQQIACHTSVAMCFYQPHKNQVKSSHRTWVGEDMPLQPLLAYIARRYGYIPTTLPPRTQSVIE